MIHAITSYFNPLGLKSKRENFRIFFDKIRNKFPLTVVEWSLKGDDFEIPTDLCDVIRISGGSLMWQKEALLNVGIANLPANCEAFAWIDGDVIFDNDNVVRDVDAALCHYDVIQPFERVIRLPRGISEAMGGCQTLFSYGSCSAKYAPQIIAEPDEDVSGTIGYAWAARRSAVPSLYSYSVCDGADRLMAHSFAGLPSTEFLNQRLNCDQLHHFMEWNTELAKGLQVGFAAGTLLHLYHGKLSNRLYTKRHERFAKFGFNPYRDVRLTPCGVLEWITPKRLMHKFLHNYFMWRNEDE